MGHKCASKEQVMRIYFPTLGRFKIVGIFLCCIRIGKKKNLSLHLMFLIDSASIFHFDLLRDFRFNLFEKVYFEKYLL